MSIGFAGSRCVDERRRRRLAQEADAALDPAARRPDVDTAAVSEAPRIHSPADSLISPRLWKHLIVALLALSAWGAMLYFGDLADRRTDGWHTIIGLKAGKLVTFFSTVMLLAAGQLALIMLWYRSHSRKDFSGSYKLWFWVGVTWLALCAFRATGSHWSLADAVLKQQALSLWNARMLLWMAPAAVAVVALYRLLGREMRDCGLSRWLLRLSEIAALASGVALLVGPFAFEPRWQAPVEAGTATLWHVLLALSMLLHARHVIHVSNESPVSPIRRLSLRLPRMRFPRIRLPRRSKSAEATEASTKPSRKEKKPPAPAKAEKASAAEAPKPAARPVAAQPVAKAPAKLPELPPEPDDLPAAKPVVEQKPSRPSIPTPSPTMQRRVDPPQAQRGPHVATTPQNDRRPIPRDDLEEDDAGDVDSDDSDGLEGLSKKERKRLRKLQKQRQRI
jgi:hypothetical protein